MEIKDIEEKLNDSMKAIEENYLSVKNVHKNSMDNIFSSLVANVKFLFEQLKAAKDEIEKLKKEIDNSKKESKNE